MQFQPVAGRGETEFGSVATYTCNTGFVLTGDGMRTCEATGMWSGKEPKCAGKHGLEDSV